MTVLEKYMVKTVKERKPKTAVPGSYLTDESVIYKVMTSKQGEKFKSLWSAIDAEGKGLTDEMDLISIPIQKLIAENASVAMSQDEYNEKYDGYAERFNQAQKQYDKLQQRKSTLAFEVDIIECFMFEIKSLPGLPMKFSDSLWNSMIEKVAVHTDGRAVFTFKNGSEITKTIS